MEPAGTKLPIAPPESYGTKCDVCQTDAAPWVKERRDPQLEEGIIDINLCFAWSSSSCWREATGKAVACEETDGSMYYLYYLNRAPQCTLAYCAISV